MKILMVINNMRLDSGVCNSVAVLANALHEKGNDVYVATINGLGPLASTLSIHGPNVIDLSKSKTNLGKIFRLNKFIRENNIDIVHTHMYKPGVIGRLAAYRTGSKTVVTEHSSHLPFAYWIRGFWENAVDSFLARRTDCLVAVSNSAAVAFAARTYILPNIITVIPNSVDLERFHKRDNKRTVANKRVILFVGRLAYEKNLDSLIEIFKSVHEEDPTVKLVVVGGGYLESEFKSRIKQLDLESFVELCGVVNNVEDFMSKADLLLLTSHWEGLPMSILEAQSCELPVVAASVPGVTDVVTHEVNGFLFDPVASFEAKDQVVRVLIRDGQVKEVIENALKKVTKYSACNIADLYLQLYRDGNLKKI